VRRPLSYFAPETRFAVGDVLTAGLQLKTLVKTLHEQGIEVLLEVRGTEDQLDEELTKTDALPVSS
jgi:hypothetical protein